jgi:large subunit ribosomal protein L10
MPKSRLQKAEMLNTLNDRFDRAQSVVFVQLAGVTVDSIEEMRTAFFPHGAQLLVPKNSLLKRVLADRGIEVPDAVTDVSMGIVFGYDDVITAPKLVTPFIKDIEALQVLGGAADGAFLSPAQVQALASLPSREQLLAQLVGTIAGPLRGLVTVLSGNMRGLVNVLTAIKDAKPAA